MDRVERNRVLFGNPTTCSPFRSNLIGFLLIFGLINIILIALYPQFYGENLFGQLKPAFMGDSKVTRISKVQNHRKINLNRIFSFTYEDRISTTKTSVDALNELGGICKSTFSPIRALSKPSPSSRNIARPSKKNNHFWDENILSKESLPLAIESFAKNEPSPTHELPKKSRVNSVLMTISPTNIISSVQIDTKLDGTLKTLVKGHLLDIKPTMSQPIKVLKTSAEISKKTEFDMTNKVSNLLRTIPTNETSSGRKLTKSGPTLNQQSNSTKFAYKLKGYASTNNSNEDLRETLTSQNLTTELIALLNRINSTKISNHSGKLNHTTSKLTTTDLLHSSENASCKLYVLSEKAIVYTTKKYKINADVTVCKDQKSPPYELCQVNETKNNDSRTKLKIKCDFSACDRTKKIFIETMDPSNGLMKRYEIPKGSNDTVIENLVRNFAENTRQKSLPFLFLNCSDRHNGGVVAQLLTFLPSLPLLKDPKARNKININLFLVDSVSRPHFYRSLPKTVNYLEEIQEHPNYPARVFNFELFQAVHGHTHENERALFNGSLFPAHLGSKARSRAPANLDRLYAVFKKAGFQTLFLDDLCWRAHWGIMDKYKIGSWKMLQEKLRVSSIDTTGITESSCAVLRRNNMGTPFFAKSIHQICYNGRHQHEYVLEYLTKYLDAVGDTPQSKPLFAYTSTHVSHDNVGIRVQTLDTHLKEHIQKMSTKDNTLTIIFADHGNTYTPYQSLADGKQEMYHPFMLMILPKKLEQKFGKTVVRNLLDNQRRLFTLFDLREGLLELSRFDGQSPLKPMGIFGKVAADRACDDLLITEQSKCICQEWETPVANTTDQLAFAEFAIGQLNNKIQASLLESRAKGVPQSKTRVVFGACQRLRVQNIRDVKTRKRRDGTKATTMDVKLQSGNLLNQEEIITVQVLWKEGTSKTYEMTLLSFNRISTYGPYRACLDKEVDVKLCICNKPDNPQPPTTIDDVFGKHSKITKLRRCLYEIRRTYTDNRNAGPMVEVIEIVNVCRNEEFTVIFDAFGENTIMSTKLPMTIELPVQTARFVAAARVIGRRTANLSVTWRVENKNSKSA